MADGVVLYRCEAAKQAVDYAAFINELSDVKGAKCDQARRFYIIMNDMVTYEAREDFNNVPDDKRNVAELCQSAPVRCRLGDVDRRLFKWSEARGFLDDAARGFGNKPDHILDQMKIALAKALVLKQEGVEPDEKLEDLLYTALDMKPLDPGLNQKSDQDEAKIRSELRHLRAQVRWHEGDYWGALTEQFGPQS